jgi:uncharacterized protein (TIGR03067 family)
MSRVAVALLALVGLTAFAPAPLPKAPRAGGKQGAGVDDLQGTWEVASFGLMRPGAGHEPGTWIKKVNIKGDMLTFVGGNGGRDVVYRITIDARKEPAEIDLYWLGDPKGSGPAMHGLIRRQMGQVEFLYSGPPKAVARPRNFEVPGVVCVRLVLHRGGANAGN